MNIKQTIKKMSALATGVAMIGATVMGAVAYDLSSYPQPFVSTNGSFNGKIVVGSHGTNAAGIASDMLGVADIAASLQAAAKTPVAVSGGTVTVSNGKVQDVLVGDGLDSASGFGSASLDYTDLPFLQNSNVDIDIGDTSNNYNYHEEIRLNSSATPETGLNVTTGLAFRSSDKYSDKAFLTAGSGSIGYYYVFDSDLKPNNFITNASSDNPITLHFLGKDLKIIGATSNSVTVDVASSYYLNVGGSVTVNGKKVELMNVGSNNDVVVSVDGQQQAVSGTETVNGIKIKVDSTFDSNTLADKAATLLIGEQTTKTYSNDDEFIGQNQDNPEWKWALSGLDTATPTIGVKWAANLDKDSGENYDNYKSVIYQGQSITFPDNFAKITFDSLTQTDYINYAVTKTTEDLYNASNTSQTLKGTADIIKITSDKSNSGLIVNGQKTDEVDLYQDASDVAANTTQVFYYDDSTHKRIGPVTVAAAGTLFTIDYSKTNIAVTRGAGSQDWNVTIPVGTTDTETLAFTVHEDSNAIDYMGTTATTDNAGLFYNSVDISSKENDLMINHGVKITDPKSDFQTSDPELQFAFPADVNDFRANIAITGSGSSTSSTATDTGAYQINQIPPGIAVVDTDAEQLLGSTPLIVVGGPYVNGVAKELMGNPTDAQIAQMFEPGKAKIKLYADQNAILVAGDTAQDTLGATRVLSQYNDPMYRSALKGDEVEVVVPSLTDISVRAPTLPSSVSAIESGTTAPAADNMTNTTQ
jgi:hypothetical protein